MDWLWGQNLVERRGGVGKETHCNTLQLTATHCNTQKILQHTATHQSSQKILKREILRSDAILAAILCNKHTAAHKRALRSVPKAVAEISRSQVVLLQHTATHCNTKEPYVLLKEPLRRSRDLRWSCCNTRQHTATQKSLTFC